MIPAQSKEAPQTSADRTDWQQSNATKKTAAMLYMNK